MTDRGVWLLEESWAEPELFTQDEGDDVEDEDWEDDEGWDDEDEEDEDWEDEDDDWDDWGDDDDEGTDEGGGGRILWNLRVA